MMAFLFLSINEIITSLISTFRSRWDILVTFILSTIGSFFVSRKLQDRQFNMEAARIHFEMIRNNVIKVLIEALEKDFLDLEFKSERYYPKFVNAYPATYTRITGLGKRNIEAVSESAEFHIEFYRYKHLYEDLLENHYPELNEFFKKYFEAVRNFHNNTVRFRKEVESEVKQYLEKRKIKYELAEGNLDCFSLLELSLGICHILWHVKLMASRSGTDIESILRDILDIAVTIKKLKPPLIGIDHVHVVKVGNEIVYRSKDVKKVENARKTIRDMVFLISRNNKIVNLAEEILNAEEAYHRNSEKLLTTLKKLYVMPVFKMEKKWLFIIKCPYVKSKIEVPKDDPDHLK